MLVGIDVIDVVRMQKFVQNERFLDKYFTSYEAMYVSKTIRKTQSLAGIYAAKEAFLKALGIGLNNGIELNEIEIRHFDNGKPYIKLSKSAQLKCLANFKITDIQISISHTDDVCTAICVLN
jgi:holo-[acyl-carrier protein] synthase